MTTDFEKHLARVPWWRRVVVYHKDGTRTFLEFPIPTLVGIILFLLGLLLVLAAWFKGV